MSTSERIKQYFEPQSIDKGVRIRDVVRETPGAAARVGKGVGTFLKEVAQGTARAVASVGITAGNAPFQVSNEFFGKNIKVPFPREIETGNTVTGRFFFGGVPVRDIKKYGESGLNEIDKIRTRFNNGEPVEPLSKRLALPLAGLGVVTELSGMGGPIRKGLTKLTDDVIEKLVATKSTDKIATLLRQSTDLERATITEVAPLLAKASNKEEVLAVSERLKQRGFLQSVEEARPNIKVPGSQIVTRSTDELAQKSANLVRENMDAAEAYVKNNSDDRAIAIGSELIKKLDEDRALAKTAREAQMIDDKIADIANDVAEKLTKSARAVQAASVIGRLTPEGQLRFAARTIQNYNELNPRKKIKQLTAEESRFILDEMKVIQGMDDGIEKSMRYDALQKYTLDRIPTPLWKKVMNVWQAGLLTGLKTTGLNLASTAANIAVRNVAKVPAVIVDKAASLLTGERSVALTFDVTRKGLKDGFNNGVRYFKTGFDERNIEDAYNFQRVNFGKGRVAKMFETYTNIVFRTLGAQDQLFYYGSLAGSLKEQAIVRAINTGRAGDKKYVDFLTENPDERMMMAAISDATSATFQNKTRLGEGLSAVRAGTGILGHFAIPFARTPAAVAMEVIHYSPIGAVEALFEAAVNGKSFDQRKFSTLLGKSATGTLGAMALGYQLQGKDRVTLEFPDNARERAMWEAEGRKANTILINGKWRSPYVLGPAGVLVLWGAHLKQALESKGSVSEAVVDATFGMGKSFIEQTAMTGVNQLAEALNNPGQFGSSYVAGLVSSFVPTLVSDVGRSIDESERDMYADNFWDKVQNRVKARIPIVRESLPEKVDAYGYDIDRIGNFWEVMVDPTRPSKNYSSPIIDEIKRLHEEGYKAAPTKIDYYPSLTQTQQVNLFRLSGTKVEDNLTSLMQKRSYKTADDDAKATMIDNEVRKAKVDARAVMAVLLMEDVPEEKRKERLAQLFEDGLLNEAVYARYKELR